MRKRPVVLLACMFTCGILWKRAGVVPVIGIGLLLYLYATPWKERGVRLVVLALGMPAVLLLGAWRFGQQEQYRDTYLSVLCEGQNARVAGKIDKIEEKTSCFYYYLTDCSVELSNQTMPCNDVLAYVSSDDYSVGQILILQGTISLFDEAVNEGMFDARSFYRSRKIDFGVWVEDVERVEGQPDAFRVWLAKMREELGIPFARYAKDDGVLSAMLLGDKTELDSEIKFLYQKSGIAHVLAISGLHISLLGMSLYRLLRHRLGLTYLLSGSSVSVFLAAYTLMTGNTVSARRAAGMLIVYLIADFFGRSYDMLSALGLIVILLLWKNPFLVANSGFLFSVAAVIGIGAGQSVLVPLVQKPLSGMAISLSIQLFMIPLVAYYYYEIPVYAIFLNIPVLALVPYVLGLAVAGSLAGQFAFLQPLSLALCRLCSLVLRGYRWLCDKSLSLPGAQFITGKPSAMRMVVYYALLGVLYYAVWCWMRRRRMMLETDCDDGTEKGAGSRKTLYGRRGDEEEACERKHGVRQAAGFVLCIAALFVILFARGRTGFELDILDVGQGDAIYLCTSDGISMMIDGGSSDVKDVGTYRILPFLKSKGIRRVSYWFVSHTDEDHISGLMEALESGYQIGYLVIAKAQAEDEKASRLAEMAKENGTRVQYMKAGDVLQLGTGQIRCLYPGAEERSEDINDRCLVLQYQNEAFRGFFGGDISSNVEERLAEQERLSEADFLKASHHGSKYANSDALLQALCPKLTVASAGKNNRYGHPSPDAIARIYDSGSAFYSTIDCGRIRVRIVDGKLQADGYCVPRSSVENNQ